jgi:hypothetical protein
MLSPFWRQATGDRGKKEISKMKNLFFEKLKK